MTARPIAAPLARIGDRFGRLNGVSRLYGRLPGPGNIGTSDTAFLFASESGTNQLQQYTVIDRVQIFCTGKVSGAVGREAVTLTVQDGAVLPFQVGTQFTGAAEFLDMASINWNTDGCLVVPPGKGLFAKVSEATVDAVILVTGYRMSAGVARTLGFDRYVAAGLRNNTSGAQAMIPAVAGKAFRIKNVYIRGFGGAAALEQFTLTFSDGATHRTIFRASTKRTAVAGMPDLKVNNCHISGPIGYGVYGNFSSTNQAWSAIVIGEYILPNKPGDTNCGQIDPTGIFSGGQLTNGGDYFWAHMQGSNDTELRLFPDNHDFYPLLDGAMYNCVPDAAPGLSDLIAVHSGAPVDQGGGALIPQNNIIPMIAGINGAGLGFANAATHEYNISWNDLGGLPCVAPRLRVIGFGTDTDITVWGRIAPRTTISGTGGIFNGL